MSDEDLLQPLRDYIRPAHTSLLPFLLLPVTLGAFLLFSDESLPAFVFIVAPIAFGIVVWSHLSERRKGDEVVRQAAAQYGAPALAEDFGRASRHISDQLRLGKELLYSRYSQNLWPWRDLASAACQETTDSDGDKCLQLWCSLRSGVSVKLYETTNLRNEELAEVCRLINQRVADVSASRPD